MKKIITYIVISLLLAGCFWGSKISNENLAYTYHSGAAFFHPEFIVYHFSMDSSRLYYKLNTDELLYTKQDDQRFSAVFKITYFLYNSIDAKTSADSGSLIIKDSRGNSPSNTLIGHLDFKSGIMPYGVLEIKLIDLNRKQSANFFVKTDKSTKQSRQTFLVALKSFDQPCFHNYVAADDTFKIQNRDPNVTSLIVKYYKRSFQVALPPFAIENPQGFDYKPDSLFTVDISNNNYFTLKKEGFYHFQIDTGANREGLTIYRFQEDFPTVANPMQLIEPLRYINTRKEFDDLFGNQNKKLALDKFWMGMGGNQERSRELIRRYYNRVLNANTYFSSHMEGWKTDRGLIFIVFGPPNVVYKSDNGESWTYGESGAMLSLNFNFTRVNNPFTDNDFDLERAPLYETSWYRAVDIWRQGRVYND
jgi:GWxTD domain-containing protein